ncbi:MAG: glycosyl hydrolase, partial [Clostridiales bacterium]|nr:glycosyl hydrolase [Candidatus Blautia equi]
AAGCDMYLFFNDIEEDFGYMMAGYKNGVITEERMTDALTRILGVKASIGLHKKQAACTLNPPKEGISVVGCEEHHKIAQYCADKYITLVKDTQKMLPISPETHKRLRVIFLEGDGAVVAGKLIKMASPAKPLIFEELRKRGFEVVDGDDYSAKGKMEDFKANTDAVLVFIDQVGFAQYNTMRLKWSLPIDQPWYAAQVPTAFVSLYLPNYLIDLTMSRTYVNCYLDAEDVVKVAIDKLCGASEFKGTPSENVWCGRWDTRL